MTVRFTAAISLAAILCLSLCLVSCTPSHRHQARRYPLPPKARRIPAEGTVPEAQKINVHVVCHTHDDVGWLKTVDQYFLGANNSIQHAGVRWVLDSVIRELNANSDRKFVYVEQAFFQMWYQRQDEDTQANVQQLVKNGQLEFINGGWCMHDEANTHYLDMIDQTTLGHEFIANEFGQFPTIGWQIDPFGHSATQAALLSATVGFKGLFFGRIDHQDHDFRMQNKEMEFIWRASPSYGANAQVFTGAFQNGNYGPPDGFCFDAFCADTPIISDPSFIDYNVPNRLQAFYDDINYQAYFTPGINLMITMGSDFQYENAMEWYTNLDELIDLVNADGKINMFYSTPSAYVDAKNAENITWSVKTDDFFPYADGDHAYWTGYFTSRPALKRYVRSSSALIQAAKQLDVLSQADSSAVQLFSKAVGVTQHHDAVAGTAKQHTTYDYAQRLHIGQAAVEDMMNAAISSFTGHSSVVFSQCELANISVCAPAQSTDHVTVIVFYNPLVRKRTEVVTVPINVDTVTVTDDTNTPLPSQVIQLLPLASFTADSAPYAVQFAIDVSPLGYGTYFITPSSSIQLEQISKNDKPSAPHKKKASSNAHASKFAPLRPVPEPATPTDYTTISNEYLTINFDSTSGNIVSVVDKITGHTTSFTQRWGYYESYTSTSGDQQSGAYIFRPRIQAVIPVAVNASQFFVSTGPVSQTVTQVITDWINQTITLYAGDPFVEIQYAVGEVPIDDLVGKEVITQYVSDIDSQSTWYTDSNGREMQTRIRNYRVTWPYRITEPISGNYVPINAAAYLNDGFYQLTLLNDRSQGVTSMTDGTLEVMVHRRTLADDSRGVGEPLNETQSCTSYPHFQRIGRGLVITGKHYLLFSNVSNAAAQWRPYMQRVYQPVVPFYTNIAAGTIPAYLSKYGVTQTFANVDLPINVDLITLQNVTSDGSGFVDLLVRVAHQFAVNEDATLSQPATVDLQQILYWTNIVKVTEMALTGQQALADMPPPLQWNTDGNTENLASFPSVPLVDTQVTVTPMQIRTFRVTGST